MFRNALHIITYHYISLHIITYHYISLHIITSQVALPSILSTPRWTRQVTQSQAKDWIGYGWDPFAGGSRQVLSYVVMLAGKWCCCTFLLISFDSLGATQGCRDNFPKQSMPMQCYFMLLLCASHSQVLMRHNFAGVYRLTFKSFYEERSRWGHKSTFILHLWIETLRTQGGIVCKPSCKLQARESCMEPRWLYLTVGCCCDMCPARTIDVAPFLNV